MQPREKLFKFGADRLKDDELLALILNTGAKGRSALVVAKGLLKVFSCEDLANLSLERLMSFPSVGPVKAARVLAGLEFSRRFLFGKQTQLILSRQAVWREMRDLRAEKREHFVVFYLDVRSQLIERKVVSIGSLNASIVHPREVFEPAIKSNSAQIIVCHNHPSGVLVPSDADYAVTRRLYEAGEILGIELLDHVIVSRDGSLSLRKFILSCRRRCRGDP